MTIFGTNCTCGPCDQGFQDCDLAAFLQSPAHGRDPIGGGTNVFLLNEGTPLTLTVARLPGCFRYFGTPADYEAQTGQLVTDNVAVDHYYYDTEAGNFWKNLAGTMTASAAPSTYGETELVVNWAIVRSECGCPHMVAAGSGTLTWAAGNTDDKTIAIAAPSHTGTKPYWGCSASPLGELASVTLTLVSIGAPRCATTGMAATVAAVCTHGFDHPGWFGYEAYADFCYEGTVPANDLSGYGNPFTPFATPENVHGYGKLTVTIKNSATTLIGQAEVKLTHGFAYIEYSRRWGVAMPTDPLTRTYYAPFTVVTTQTTRTTTDANGWEMKETLTEPVDKDSLAQECLDFIISVDPMVGTIASFQLAADPGMTQLGASVAPWTDNRVINFDPGIGTVNISPSNVVRVTAAYTGGIWSQARVCQGTRDATGCYYGHPTPQRVSLYERVFAYPSGTFISDGACVEITETRHDYGPPTASNTAVEVIGCTTAAPNATFPPVGFQCYPGIVAP